jgi:hypothetical protein
LEDKIKSSGQPRFTCDLTLPAGKRDLCTVAYKHPDVLERWDKEHRLSPGKFLEMVDDHFK